MKRKRRKCAMQRMRRLRVSEGMRSLVRETSIEKSDLVYPIFVIEGTDIKNPVDSMPGIYQYSIDRLEEELKKIWDSGVRSILIFGIPAHKDEVGSSAYDEHGITQEAIRFIKSRYPKLLVIADVCLCEYTSHGHCGLVCGEKILNDETLPLLGKMSVSLARAGADIIAPSDMMDGRIGYIRNALDENGFLETAIMAYSAKFASGYYSPFRDAAHSAPGFGDRKTYQMDSANGKEALREIKTDIAEGADIVMVKPALAYLDVVRMAADQVDYPIAVYNVSGEYAMVKAAAANGWIDEKRIVMENMIAMKRAGAKIIITYHALEVARWLSE
jgi:porphobilinogen synthase